MDMGKGTVEHPAVNVGALRYGHHPLPCDVRPGQRGVYLVIERSNLAYTPNLEYILLHPSDCELLPRHSTVPFVSFQRGQRSVRAEQ
jgi:hypothetical protein